MSKSSCAAADSIPDALLRMARETGALTCGSSHVAFCRQISCSHENLLAESYRGSATLMSKNSCAAAESIADAFLRMARGNWGTDVRKFPCSFLQADFMLA